MVKPELSIFSGTQSLGRIFSEQNQINVKFWEINIPLSNTAGRISQNVMGKTRIVVLQGGHTGDGFVGSDPEDKLKSFIYEMEQWINVDEQDDIVYTDSFGVNYSMDGVDWSWTRSFKNPNQILWSLIMKET